MARLKLVGVALALVCLYGGWLVLRDTPIFRVQQVAIAGLRGPGSSTIRAALDGAARGMTTTHFDLGRLRAAVAPYPLVKSVRAQTQFPHGLRIQVTVESPVAALVVGGQRLPLAADGKIVRGMQLPIELPTVQVAAIPTGARISDPLSFAALEVLDVAPRALRGRLATITNGTHGLTVALRAGPRVYFGDTTRLHAKWAAVARVLADTTARGAAYVDVHTPDRPAAQVGDPLTAGAAATAPGTAAGPLLTQSTAAPGG